MHEFEDCLTEKTASFPSTTIEQMGQINTGNFISPDGLWLGQRDAFFLQKQMTIDGRKHRSIITKFRFVFADLNENKRISNEANHFCAKGTALSLKWRSHCWKKRLDSWAGNTLPATQQPASCCPIVLWRCPIGFVQRLLLVTPTTLGVVGVT